MRPIRIAVTAVTALLAASLAPPALGAVTTARIGAEPRAGVHAAGKLWVLGDRGGDRVLVEADGRTGRPTGREVLVTTGLLPGPKVLAPRLVRPSLTVAGGYLWTAVPSPDQSSNDLVRVDPRTAAVTLRVPLGANYVAAGPSGLWVTAAPELLVDAMGRAAGAIRRVVRVDPSTGAVVDELRYGPGMSAPLEIAVADTGVWLTRGLGDRGPLMRLPSDGRALPANAWQLFARGGTGLFADRGSCRVTVAPPTGRLRDVALCTGTSRPRDVALSGGAIWRAGTIGGSSPRGFVSRRALDGRGPIRAWRVGRDPVDVVPSGAGVWVLNRADRTLTRVTP
ncbi:MAG: hypothetical protein AB7V62_02380 [Thermoleophilia bacterium]